MTKVSVVSSLSLPFLFCSFFPPQMDDSFSLPSLCLQSLLNFLLTGLVSFSSFSIFFPSNLLPLHFLLCDLSCSLQATKPDPITLHQQYLQSTALKVKGPGRWTLLPQIWSFYSFPWEDRGEAESV